MVFDLGVLTLGLVLSATHLISEFIEKRFFHNKGKIISFTLGVTVTFIFLELLTETFSPIQTYQRLSMIFILIGFTLYHFLEKHAYHHHNQTVVRSEIKEYHTIAVFLYHTLVGFLLGFIAIQDFTKGLLFMIPVMFHTISSSLSFRDVEETMKENKFVQIILVVSSLIGIIFAMLIEIPPVYYHSFLGLVIGIMLYVVVRDSIPAKEGGHPKFFIAGAIIYSLIVFLKWTLIG